MKDYENALINYQKAVEIGKGFALYHFGTGITLISLKEYEESIKHLKIAYEIEPENAEYSGNLGLSYFGLKDYSVAINYFLESLEVNSIHAIRWAYLGNSYYFAGANGLAYDAHKRALSYGTESISIDAGSLSIFAVNNLILARESNDNDYSKSLLQEGLVMISMALDLYPDNSDYIYIRDLIIEEQEK
jgi:tetratricopeptide (TPR) repeat protein